MEIEVKRLRDEVTTLTTAIETAIEQAIKKGHKSLDGCKDNPGSRQFSCKDFTYTRMNVDSSIVGWVDDF